MSEESILIVDSNEAFATILREALDQSGEYQTTVTNNGDEALAALTAGSFDLAIVDLGLEKKVSVDLFDTWSDYNLYTGVDLRGWPIFTLLRGRVLVRAGEVQVYPGYGRFILRQAIRDAAAQPRRTSFIDDFSKTY